MTADEARLVLRGAATVIRRMADSHADLFPPDAAELNTDRWLTEGSFDVIDALADWH